MFFLIVQHNLDYCIRDYLRAQLNFFSSLTHHDFFIKLIRHERFFDLIPILTTKLITQSLFNYNRKIIMTNKPKFSTYLLTVGFIVCSLNLNGMEITPLAGKISIDSNREMTYPCHCP